MAKRDAHINELQGQNDEMTKRMLELNASLGTLEKQIADTEKKLARPKVIANFFCAS